MVFLSFPLPPKCRASRETGGREMCQDGCHDNYTYLVWTAAKRSSSSHVLQTEAWPLNPACQGTTAGHEQGGILLTQPCVAQELWQEGLSVCSSQHISPLQNPGAAQEPAGSSPLALGFARCIGALLPPPLGSL